MEKSIIRDLIKIILIVGLTMWVLGLILIIFYRNTNDEFMQVLTMLMSNDKTGNNSIGKNILNFSIIWLPTVLFLPTIVYITNRINYKRKEISYTENYREIEDKYTPAIASFMIDKTAEKNKDVLATILDLNVRGYLTIKTDKEFIISIEDKNTDNLFLHEKYVIEQIKENKRIDLNRFVKLVEGDCKKEGLVKEREAKRIDIIYVIVFITCMIILNKPIYTTSDFIIKIIIFIGAAFSFTMMVSKMIFSRTQKGREIAIKYKGLKNYLKEYTLVKTRDIEYVNILDRYLTFALALGEADTIEKLYVSYNKLISKYIEGGK